jgi:NAD(P)-dependent dehydrogenase (short-subunit alcohol dehydrogenase family)
MNSEYKNKTYLVTGASSGIGRSVCLELSSLGANVVLLARNETGLAETQRLMTQEGRHTIRPFDVSAIADIAEIVNSIFEHYERIDGLVYSAGRGGQSRLRDTVYDLIHSLMLVNFYAFIEFVRCLMKKKPKSQVMRIVGISSLASVSHEKYFTAYAASKAALEASVRTMATEIIPRNATINVIRPAFVNTAMIAGMNEILGDFEAHIKSTGYQPQGLIAPEDVAKLAVYLLGDAAKSITGAVVPINAGAAF